MRRILRSLVIAAALLALPRPALAGWDFLLFLGQAYPKSDNRLTFNLPAPSIPGVDVTVNGTPRIKTVGGPTFGGAVTAEAGIIGIEGRLDVVNVHFNLTGARYDLAGAQPPYTGLTGAVVLSDGRFDVDRLTLWSVNVRLRTPGPVGLVASGGVTFLPSFNITGSVPIAAETGGESAGTQVHLALTPGTDTNRFGVNAGVGLRIGAPHLALVAEGRVFYFRDYDLQIQPDVALPAIGGTAPSFDVVHFRPLIVTAQIGLLFGF